LTAAIKFVELGCVAVSYSSFSFFPTVSAIGLLLFNVILSMSNIGRNSANQTRRLLGSVFLSAGITTVLFAVFVCLVNVEDSGPRCLGGCAPSLQQYYNEVFLGSIIVAVLGLVAAGLGIRLLMRRVKAPKFADEIKIGKIVSRKMIRRKRNKLCSYH
jgi:hypothetical protein